MVSDYILFFQDLRSDMYLLMRPFFKKFCRRLRLHGWKSVFSTDMGPSSVHGKVVLRDRGLEHTGLNSRTVAMEVGIC